MNAKQKLQQLRKRMKEEGIAAWLQPVHDAYMNEYPPECVRRVEWLSGFSGSAGMVVVLAKKAALFTDGRYTLQAKNEVPSSLYEQYNTEHLRPEQWLQKHLKSGAVAGYDPMLHTRGVIKRLEAVLGKTGVSLAGKDNLIDTLWKERPLAPTTPVTVHGVEFSGEASAKKRSRVAKSISAAGAGAAIITAPDSVCWLLNIRANDVEGAPLLLAPLIIDAKGKVTLFADEHRFDKNVKAHLGKDVTLLPFDALKASLSELGKKDARVLCDAATLPCWYIQTLTKAGATIVDGVDPCVLPKAMKNAVELKGIRAAHIRDGVAVTQFLCWLDKTAPRQRVTELEAVDKLLYLRAAHPLFAGPSFNTIAGSGPNGAIVHYRASAKTSRVLKKGELFLLDSGGQYPDGTTDITRTVPIGAVGKEEKDRFTRVLKGHIALAMARFPEGTSGSQLDALARQYLWEAGLDYDHGTGHGVGHFLNVHEGPQRIGKRGGDAPLAPGMIISNEPGYYKTGAYGIRIESLVAVKAGGNSDGRNFLSFETLTCAPIDTRLVLNPLLGEVERKWLNSYHAWVYKALHRHLTPTERAWLKKRCSPL